MKVEWLIYFYMAVSVMMLLFDVGFTLRERGRARSMELRAKRMADDLERVFGCMDAARMPARMHMLERALGGLSGMEAFDIAMERASARGEEAGEYLAAIAPVFEQLAPAYARREPLEQAYFAYMVKRWYRSASANKELVAMLLDLLRSKSLYVRQNAFEALAAIASPHDFARAIALLDGAPTSHSARLITEVALGYAGDVGQLAEELKSSFVDFGPRTQAAVVNFLRMTGAGETASLLRRMTDSSSDKEVRLACVRYFMRNRAEEAREPLLEMAQLTDPVSWDYASVAALALASYPGEETVRVLKRCLSSRSWHVRHNAAKSLYDLGCTLDGDLRDVMEGSDGYARDMLVYRWETEKGALG